jgi:hypothetical protein
VYHSQRASQSAFLMLAGHSGGIVGSYRCSREMQPVENYFIPSVISLCLDLPSITAAALLGAGVFEVQWGHEDWRPCSPDESQGHRYCKGRTTTCCIEC